MGAREPVRVLLVGPDPPGDVPPGVEPVWIPIVRARPVPGSSLEALRTAEVHRVDAIVFTSPRAPRALVHDAASAGVTGLASRLAAGRTVWAIGPSTARAVREYLGVEPRVPREYRGRTLGLEVARSGATRVLGLRGSKVVPDLENVLRAHGVGYVEVTVYTLEPVQGAGDRVRRALERVDAVVLTSPFIASLFHREVGWPSRARVVAIGPTTAGAVERLGGSVYCYPRSYTLRAALECLAQG